MNEGFIVELCLARLSDLHGQKVVAERKQPVGGGCINNAVLLKCNVGNFFLKWNSSCPGDMFLKEAAGLQEMYSVENPYLIIPKVIWAKQVDELPGLLLMEYLQPSGVSSGQDEKLGRGLAALHRKIAPQFGFHHDNYCGLTMQNNAWNTSWIDFFGTQRIGYLLRLIECSRGISSEEMKMYGKLIDRLPELLSHETKPSLIHGDLWSGNCMYTVQWSGFDRPGNILCRPRDGTFDDDPVRRIFFPRVGRVS